MINNNLIFVNRFNNKTKRGHMMIFCFILILGMCRIAVSQESPSALLPCCSYIQVTAIQDQDSPCCIKLSIINPYCYNMKVKIDKNSNSGIQSIGPLGINQGDTLLVSLCAEPNETLISYVVYCQNEFEQPYCFDSPIYHEGTTMFSGSVPVYCCGCPPDFNNFLTLTTIPNVCPNEGCRVIHNLNIPSNMVDCFSSVIFESSRMQRSTSPLNIWNGAAQQHISSYDFCLSPFETYDANILLVRNNGEVVRCESWKMAKCDTLPKKELCVPDCHDTPWGNIVFDRFKISSCPGCEIRVFYTWRQACKIFQDLQIAKIELLSPECKSCNIDNIYREILGKIFVLNRMNFKPKERGDCDVTWRVANGSCWATWFYYLFDKGKVIDTISVYEPCDSVACCLQPLKVCMELDGSKTVTPIGTGEYSGNCINKEYIDPLTKKNIYCEPACDWLAKFQGNFIIFHEHLYKKELKEFDYSNAYGVLSSFENNLLNIIIRSARSAEATLQLLDINGREVARVDSKLSMGTNNISINTTKLMSGIYIYILSIDGHAIHNNKVSIIN